ncbi:MAG: RNA polymerase sigma-70 factor, ECF subfamily [Elusimicrobia bacterium]|nr:MAG: RNA polymerase sigma-70 factor, ECF subfamily [Elusimicrobiota bacterium]
MPDQEVGGTPAPGAGTSRPDPVSNKPSEDEFLRDAARPVYNLALRLTGNPSDAEDLAQDALLRCLKALPGFRGDSSATSWAYRVTMNTWKNRVRSEKRRGFWKTLPLAALFGGGDEDSQTPTAEPPAKDAPLDAELETMETGEAVQAALMTLDEESRAVVVLREIKGMSYTEISEALTLPEGTVKSRLFRARAVLKSRLARFVEGS